MIADKKDEYEVKTEIAGWSLKLSGFVMSIAIVLSSWFLNQAWDRINLIEHTVKVLELSDAKHDSSTISSYDFGKYKEALDHKSYELDRRITRLEESLPVIKDTLLEIKNTIRLK